MFGHGFRCFGGKKSDKGNGSVLQEYEVLEEEFKAIFPSLSSRGDERHADKKEFTGTSGNEKSGGAGDGNAKDPLTKLREKVHKLETPLTALCLSGGGIRSATFCLGVLQALAKKPEKHPKIQSPAQQAQEKPLAGRQLARFHYLSTVSGGGYIGSWLSHWIKQDRLCNVIKAMAGGKPEPPAIGNLRAFSNYLAPRRGWSADTWSLVVLYVRNLLLNWLVLVPLLFAVLLLPRLNLNLLAAASGTDPVSKTFLAAGIIFLAMCVVMVALSLPSAGQYKLKNAYIQKMIPWLLCTAAWLLIQMGMNVCIPCIIDGGITWLETCFCPPCAGGGAYDGITVMETYVCTPYTCEGASWFLQSVLSVFPFLSRLFNFLGHWQLPLFISLAAHVLAGIVMFVYHRVRRRTSKVTVPNRGWRDCLPTVFGLVASMTATTVMLWFGMTVLLPGIGENRILLATFTVPYILLAYVIVGTVWVGATSTFKWSTEADREWWATSGGGAAALAVGWICLHILVFYLPGAVLNLGAVGAVAFAGAGGLAGIATALGGYWSRIKSSMGAEGKNNLSGIVGKRALQVGALFFIVLFLGVGGSLLNGYLLTKLNIAKTSCPTTKDHGYFKTIQAVDQFFAVNECPSKECGQAVSQVKSELCKKAVQKDLAGLESWLGRKPHDVDRTIRQWSEEYESSLSGSQPACLALIWVALVVWVIGGSALLGVNRFSLHGMYANRLVRAYLGASRPKGERRPDPLSGFDENDNVSMSDLSGGEGKTKPSPPARLFHVVNAALNLVGGARLEWQQRKASSFTISPLHAGSWTLGYQRVEKYGGDKGISLGKAMGISGAAVSPNMGYHSSSLVACVMTFFNARLGWWLPNPGPKGENVWDRKEPKVGISLLAQEAIGKTTDETKYVYLSDGGHFDNLGLYEMVRRRCKRILIVDAGADPDYRYEDLAATVRKIHTDMGIRVEFPEKSGPALQRPPKGPYTVGWIHYPDVDRVDEARVAPPGVDRVDEARVGAPGVDEPNDKRIGVLVYMKPVLTGGEPVDVIAYARDHHREGDCFPHQSTADQFFDEAQFESYRMLGEYMATQVMAEIRGLETFNRVGSDAISACDAPPLKGGPAPAAGGGGGGGGGSTGSPFGKIGEVAGKVTRPGVMGSVLGAAQTWGPATLLMTTLTIGGMVGVAGTVALSSGNTVGLSPGGEVALKSNLLELQLNPEARELLGKGIGIRLQAPVSFDVGNLKGDIKALSAAVGKLSAAIGPVAPGNGPNGPDAGKEDYLSRKVLELANVVNTLSGVLAAGGYDRGMMNYIGQRLWEMEGKLSEIQGQMESRLNFYNGFDGLQGKLDDVKLAIYILQDTLAKEVKALKDRVDLVQPRKNVRGGGGAQ